MLVEIDLRPALKQVEWTKRSKTRAIFSEEGSAEPLLMADAASALEQRAVRRAARRSSVNGRANHLAVSLFTVVIDCPSESLAQEVMHSHVKTLRSNTTAFDPLHAS
jgi:hypothetical protein